MRAALAEPRSSLWAPALAAGVLCNGIAAGVWKHADVDVARFCVLFAIAKLVVGGGLWAAGGRPSFTDRVSRPFLGYAFLAASINGLGWIAYFIAFTRGPLGVVQSVTAAYTAFAAVLAVLFLRERLSRAQAVGVALVVAAGVLLAYTGEAPGVGARSGGWLAASFAAVGFWGVTAVMSKHAYDQPRADHARFFLVQALGLLIAILPYGLALAPAERRGPGSGAGALIVALLYVAGDLGVYAAIARGPGSIVNPLAGLYPIPAIAYGVLVLGDVPDRVGCAAIAMVLPGLVLAVRGERGPTNAVEEANRIMNIHTNDPRGMEVVRRLEEDERRLLRSAFEATRTSGPEGVSLIHWANLYLNRAFTMEHPWREELHAWVTRNVAHVYASWPEVHVLAYGFITNPAKNPHGQPFHVDYTRTSSNLFVPLTRVSPENATEFIRQPLTRARLDHKAEFGSLDDILDAEGCDAIEVVQLVCRPYSLIRLLPSTPHRGIANGEDYDRVMFFVTVDDHDHALPETAHFKYSTEEYTSVATGAGERIRERALDSDSAGGGH